MNPDLFGINVLIAIDGPSGSGKSTLASLLSDELGASVLHVDDFTDQFEPWSGTGPIIEQLRAIRRGAKTLSYPRLQAKPDEDQRVIDQPVTNAVILEGVGASRDEIRKYLDYIIFVDAPEEVRIARIIERDVDAPDGRSMEEQDEIGQIWDRAEKKYFAGVPEQHAHIILDGDLPFEPRLEELGDAILSASF